MDIILGSFNVLNLNTKDNEKSDFKEDKCSKIADIIRKEHIPTFTYDVPSVTVTSYYDDVQSLSVRLDNYFDMGVKAVGFWCLGQEDPRIWSHLSVSQREEVTP
mgnify:CR=1 FL=1